MLAKQTFDKELLSLVLTLVLVSVPAFADGLFEEAVEGTETKDEEDKSDARGFFAASPVELNGYVRGDLYLGKVPGEDVTEVKNGYGEVSAQLKVRLGEWGDGVAEARVARGYDGHEVAGTFNLREAYTNLYLGPFDLRFGHQIIAWGRADGFNPTDNLTPRDMRVRSPNEDDRRAANLALRITWNAEPLRWEVAYLPFYAPAHFPAFDLPGPITLAEPDNPDADFEHGILASRINVELAFIDFSVSYLFGYSTFPGLGFIDLDISGPALNMQFRAFQHQVAGADFATTVGDLFGLRGEVALRWPKEEGFAEHVPRPDLQYVLGIDREFGDVYVIVQYVGKTVLEWEQLEDTPLQDLIGANEITPEILEKLAPYLADPEELARLIRVEVERKTRMVHQQTEEVSHSAFLRLQYKLLQETLTLEVMGLYNFSTREYLLVPRITYSVADGLTLTAGAEIYGGPEDTLFGMVEEMQSAGFLEVKAFF